ncbi:outer membrane beta-barrel protein [Pendulispora brunnea]|uniref:Outer membrane beta-barrel protein n=1 Tax=Pendulispora brunnea TaxID=2905690 RepID=A0ABZ2KIA4_9BACT
MYEKPKTRSLAFAGLAALIVLASIFVPSRAHAQQRDLLSLPGSKGQLAIDSLMGFRIGAFSGVSYAGPLGFSTQSYKADDVQNNNNEVTTRLTTFWFAPAADYFIIDRLSVGGLLEIASTSRTDKTKTTNGGNTVENETDRPTTTAFTFLPRVGYMFPITSRFAVWPRGGIGYATRQNVVGGGKESFSSLIFSADVPVIFRINETFFVSAAPELTFSLGGEHTLDVNNASRSADASFFQFGLVTGLGVLLDL